MSKGILRMFEEDSISEEPCASSNTSSNTSSSSNTSNSSSSSVEEKVEILTYTIEKLIILIKTLLISRLETMERTMEVNDIQNKEDISDLKNRLLSIENPLELITKH